ncbi:ribbon-helix-helix protein, CopG family [Sphingorhabdus sp. IMCC26285]|uniref:Ribbon-helix-helix protein, CopG family n=1 Tax=Sphingorhabdus profundilacus TaxID=2509718 RepID=A0A6I4LYX4_9SPHN|nr:type II toxin-antitoxin system ParD family antitoxin [Sphingorhabdus profundilacus]MVZ97094.1 ribbon-helix-helix protein, CopG family [Sphingorhabdus profundilacus]
MSKLERITVTMPEEMAARMRAAVESGEYATTSEIVREALRDWQEYQERRLLKLEKLRDLIAEGERGPYRSATEVLDELEAKYLKIAELTKNSAA